MSQIEHEEKFPARLSETRARAVAAPVSGESYACALEPTCVRPVGYQIESPCLSYFPREFSARRPPAKSSEISKRGLYGASATSSGKFDTVARSSESAVDAIRGKLPEADSTGNQALRDMPSIMRSNSRRGPFKRDFPGK